MKLRSFSIESCVLYVMKVKVMIVVIIQMSLLEEKTPSKQFVMPKEVRLSLPPFPHSLLPASLSCPPPLHIQFTHTLPHTITTHTHTHTITTHTHTTGWFNGGISL